MTLHPLPSHREPTLPASHGQPDQHPGSHHRLVGFYFVLALILGAVDAILIKTVWNVILQDNEAISWAMAIVTAFGATLLAWTAGAWSAVGSIDRHRGHLLGAAAAAIVWVAVGAAMFWLRWETGTLTATGVNTEGATADNATTTHHILAIALIALYLMPGVLAALHGYETGNPVAARQRASHAQLQLLEAELRHLEARTHEMDLLLAQHHATKNSIDDDAKRATAQANALADELKAYARLRIAQALATPSGVESAPPHTNPTTQTTHNNTDNTDTDHDDDTDDDGQTPTIHAA